MRDRSFLILLNEFLVEELKTSFTQSVREYFLSETSFYRLTFVKSAS